MALIKKEASKTSEKEYATDDKSMRADAREYAKRDISTVIGVFKAMFPKQFETVEAEETITKSIVHNTVEVKYQMIKKARTERPMWEQFLGEDE